MLTSLRVEAFENHTATDIDLSRVNWFTGGNGQGKSAIANALEYLLTGGTDLVPNGGAGMLAYIQDGKPRASVQAQVGADLITRELPAKAGVTSLQAFIDNRFKSSKDGLRAVMRTRHFWGLSAREQKELLEGILVPALTERELVEALSTYTPEAPDLGKWFDDHLPEAKQAKSFLKWAEETRRDLKKGAADLARQIDALARTEPVTPPAKTVADAQKKHDATTERLAELRRRQSGAALREWEAQRAVREQAASVITAAGDEIRAISKATMERVPGFSVDACRAKLESAESALELAKAALRRIPGRLAADATSPCPAGSCARMEAAALAKAEKIVADGRLALSDAARSLDAAHASAREEASLNARAKAANERLEVAQQTLTGMPKLAPRPKSDEAADEVKRLEATLDETEIVLQAAADARVKQLDFDLCVAERDNLRDKQGKATRDLVRLEALCKALGAGGIDALRIGVKLAEFVEAVNGSARASFNLEMRIDPLDWCVTARKVGQTVWRPVGLMSWAERAELSACFQTELAELTGIPFVVLDEVALDTSRRPAFLSYLLDSRPQYIVLSTAQEVDDSGDLLRAVDPGIDDLRIFWVADGHIVPAPQAAALLV